jgi:hypothetical protein
MVQGRQGSTAPKGAPTVLLDLGAASSAASDDLELRARGRCVLERSFEALEIVP